MAFVFVWFLCTVVARFLCLNVPSRIWHIGHRSNMYALKNIITSTHGGDAPLMSLDLTCYGKATKGTPYLVDEMCLTVIQTGSISQQV